MLLITRALRNGAMILLAALLKVVGGRVRSRGDCRQKKQGNWLNQEFREEMMIAWKMWW